MIITNNSESQSLKIIPRESSLTYTGSSPKQLSANALSILLTEEGSNLTQSAFNLVSYRYDNCLTLNFNQINSFFREGFYYLITISTNNTENNLVYRDKISVLNSSDVPYNDKTRYSINESQYIILQDTDGSNVYNEGDSDYESTGGGYVPNDSSTGQVNPNDTNNDGYGEATSVNETINNFGFNLYGEYTVDHTQFGTFTTADNYTALSVENFFIPQPSAVSGGASFNQYGLADGMNGYIRYRHGYDYTIAEKGSKQYLADRLTNEGVTARSNDDSDFLDVFTETVYLGNDQESIAVGDSIYVDANGTKLADGTTNGRNNRYWFMHKDSNNKYMICKVTAGVVTHYYEWRDGPEGWLRFNYTNRWQSEGVSDESLMKDAQKWIGDSSTGGLVTQNTFAEAIAEAQDRLNNNYSITVSDSTLNDDKDVWLDFRTVNGDSTGDFIYRFNQGNYNVQLSNTDNLEIATIVDSSGFKQDETEFKYLPLYSEMFAHASLNGVGKGVIVIEYKKYTGEIVNSNIVYKNN